MDIHSTAMTKLRRDGLERDLIGIRADCAFCRRGVDYGWPVSDKDGWFMRKIGKPILDYLLYLAR